MKHTIVGLVVSAQLVVASFGWAQSAPTFDAVSIKPNNPATWAGGTSRAQPGRYQTPDAPAGARRTIWRRYRVAGAA